MSQYNINIEWGRQAALRAASRHDIIIIVDALSFSTTTATAINNGLAVFPCATYEEAAMLAVKHNCECSVPRKDVPSIGRFSLSPVTVASANDCDAIVMRSVNGAAITQAASSAQLVLIGALVNAEAVAEYCDMYCSQLAVRQSVTVIACGELVKQSEHEGDFRFAIEDYLGAGAVISFMGGEKTVEAQLCERMFKQEKDNLNSLLLRCESGVELVETGFANDVNISAKLNSIKAIPMLAEDRICPAQKQGTQNEYTDRKSTD